MSYKKYDEVADYDPSLDILNPNRSYMDIYPDLAEAAKDNPAMKAAEAPIPTKLTQEEYFQRRIEEKMSPSAAEVKPVFKTTTADEEKQLNSNVKSLLDTMNKNIALNYISFEDFELYYGVLKFYISVAKDYLPYVMTLYNATVICKNLDDKEIFKTKSKELKNIIKNALCKALQEESINLASDYAKIKGITENSSINISQFFDSFYKLRLAMFAQIEGIDYLDWAKTLKTAVVFNLDTSTTELIQYHDCLELLYETIKQLEQAKKLEQPNNGSFGK